MSGINSEFTEQEIAAMSPEERMALVDDPTLGEPLLGENVTVGPEAGQPTVTGQPAVEPVPGQPAPGAVPPAEVVPVAGEAPAAAETLQPDPAAAPDVGKVDRSQPFIPMRPTKHTIPEIDKAMEEVEDQFNKGELDMVDFMKQWGALRDERKDIEHNANSQQQLWQYEQSTFYDQNPQFHPDTGKGGNPVLHGAIKHVFDQLERDPVNAGKTGHQLLNEAKKQVHEHLNSVDIRPGAQPQPSGVATPTAPRTLGNPPPALASTEIPKTLGGIPIAQGSDVGPDEFTQLDSLSGADFEKALARLSPDQEKRYLQRG